MNFKMGKNLKKIKLTFWAEKYTNIVLEYTKGCGIATLGRGDLFSKKISICLYFQKKIRILDF